MTTEKYLYPDMPEVQEICLKDSVFRKVVKKWGPYRLDCQTILTHSLSIPLSLKPKFSDFMATSG